MAYTKQEFKSGDKLYAAQLNAMDAQIAANEEETMRLSEEIEEIRDADRISITGTVVKLNTSAGKAILVKADTAETVTLVHQGKNFLPSGLENKPTVTESGVTATANMDGSVTIKGTATTGVMYDLMHEAYGTERVFPAGKYVASVKTSGLNNSAVLSLSKVMEDGSTEQLQDVYSSMVNGLEFELDKPTRMRGALAINPGIYDQTMFFQIERGKNVTDYEKYTAIVNETPLPVVVEAHDGTNILYTTSGDALTASYSTEQSVDDIAEKVKESIKFDPTQYGLPVLYLNGDISEMTKENAVSLDYVFGDKTGTLTCKWQGSSSLTYPKKNFTLKFDEAFEAKTGWGMQKKYCTKANFIDFSHARNIISATLWGQIVKSRTKPESTYEEVFDLSSVTDWEGTNGTAMPEAFTISDGVVTANMYIYQSHIPMWLGQTYEPGNYTLSFDYYCGGIADGFAFEGVWYGIGKYNNEDYMKEAKFTAFGEWTHLELPIYNALSEGYLIFGTLYQPGIQFKNISLKKKSFDGIFDMPNGGAIDGFPIVIMINGEFQGLYTFNIPKDGWMMGMGKGTHEAILCADYSDAAWFRGEATLDGDFDVEYATDENDTEWIKTSVNRLINACRNSDGTDLDTTVAQYLDWDSAIDYYILKKVLNGVDMGGKNYILATYDGVKWFFSAYDMDCVYGLDWDGKRYYSVRVGSSFIGDDSHLLDNLIRTHKKDALKQRYIALRNSILSDDNVVTLFANFIGGIPSTIYVEDARRWPTIPNTSTNNLHQIVDFWCRRAAILDKNIEAL